jgi:butyrate kinase
MDKANSFRILALNPGSTSTKLGLFENEQAVFQENVKHEESELAPYAKRPLVDQLELRTSAVLGRLEARGADPAGFDAVVGRGGLLRPLASGTYAVGPRLLADLKEAKRGDHASNLGAPMALALASRAPAGRAFIVDPVSVDGSAFRTP